MKIRLIGVILCLAILTSCQKEEVEDISTFSVQPASLTIKAGEEAKFILTGDPSQISFYSGEVGNAYDFKDMPRIDKVAELMFQFDSHNTPTDAVEIQLMFSTDFNGVYKYEDVSAATWHDLSTRFRWAAPAPWQTNWQASGAVNLADMLESGSPFFIAYRYVAPPVPDGSIPGRNWRTRSHTLRATTEYGHQVDLASYKTMGWQLVKKDTLLTSSSTVASTILLIGATSGHRLEYEEWGISKMFEADEIDMGVDQSVPIKGYADMPPHEFTHVYTEAGTYTATFVASNKTAYNDNEVVKHVDITVVEP